MSNFNYEAYREVYPEVTAAPEIESAVEGFKPTEEALKAQDEVPGESALPDIPDVETAEEPEGEEI